MRFLVDECAGPAVAHWLRKQKHQVFSVYDEARGMDDEDVIAKAFAEKLTCLRAARLGAQPVAADGG